MKFSGACVFAAITAAMLLSGLASAQSPNSYYSDTPWPVPSEGTSAFRLTGMKSVHAVWMAFTKYADGKPVMDSPVITLLEGSTIKWSPPGGCVYELQLVNSDPPVINMTKRQICMLDNGGKVIFRILAAP
jgi:hypothetical protein